MCRIVPLPHKTRLAENEGDNDHLWGFGRSWAEVVHGGAALSAVGPVATAAKAQGAQLNCYEPGICCPE